MPTDTHSGPKGSMDEAFEDLLEDAEDAEEVHGDGEPRKNSQLQDGLEDLQNIMGGLASRLLGPNAAKRMDIDPEKPVISPEVDKVIGDIGDTLGRLLTQAGDELKKAAKKPEDRAASGAADADSADGSEPSGEEEPEVVEPELEGWSPLVLGARAFASGLGAVAGDVVEKLTPVVEQALHPNKGEE